MVFALFSAVWKHWTEFDTWPSLLLKGTNNAAYTMEGNIQYVSVAL